MGPILRAFAATVCLCSLFTPALAERLRIQSLDGPGSIATTGLEKLADELRSASGGEIDIEVLPVRSAVGPAATLDAMKSGALDGHYSSPAYFARKDPAFALLGDTLAAFPDPETRDRWFSESRGIEYARKLYDQHGIHLIGTVYWPEEWLVANRPATLTIDLSGRKIRAPDGPISDLLTRIGARTVTLSGREALAKLEENEIDATDWATLAKNIETGAHAHAKFAIRTRHSMPVTEISLSNDAWNRLSPRAQKLFENKVQAFSQSQKAAFDSAFAAARAEARKQGVTLLDLSKTSQAKLRDAALAVFAEWGEKSPAAKDIAASQRAYLERLGLVAPASADGASAGTSDTGDTGG